MMKRVDTITVAELTQMAENMLGNLVKAVVDIKQQIFVVDAELHVDQEESKQSDLWDINLYPEKFGTDEFIEFDSMINIRQRQNNRSRGIEDENVREEITAIVKRKVTQ